MHKSISALLFAMIVAAVAQVAPELNSQEDDNVNDPVASAKLPAAAEAVVPAMNGDLLVVKLEGKKLIGIVDVEKRKLVKTLKTSTSSYLFAAGGDRAVVYDPDVSVFTTYSLKDFERVKAKKSPFTGVVASMTMGSNNGEFALLRVSTGTDALDNVHYARLDLTTLNGDKLEGVPHNSSYRDDEHMRLGPDGRFFSAWCTSHSPTGQIVGMVSEDKIEIHYEHNSVGHILPLPTKNRAVTGNGAVLSSSNRIVKQHRGISLFPDMSGSFYVGVTGQQVQVFASGSHQMFNTLKMDLAVDRWGRTSTLVMPMSTHKVLATLSQGRDAIEFYKFDPIGDLEDSDLDYLIVLSTPPDEVKPGETFAYEPEIATNAENWSVDALAVPDDAEVVDKTKIVWEVPSDFDGDDAEFLLRVNTSNDDEVFHEFTVRVVKDD